MLNRHPSVRNSAVAAVPDPIRGDEVFAFIIAEDNAEPDAVMAWCLEQLAYYKAPGYIHFVDQLPLTATNKVQRGPLKAKAAALVSDPATIDCRAMKKRGA